MAKGNIKKSRRLSAQSCSICGHVLAEKHRVVFGEYGGKYTSGNVVHVCPNHHAALHFLTACFLATTNTYFPLKRHDDGLFHASDVLQKIINRIDNSIKNAKRLEKKGSSEHDQFYIRLSYYFDDADLMCFFWDVVTPIYIRFLNSPEYQVLEKKWHEHDAC